jgi:hypothetical protein
MPNYREILVSIEVEIKSSAITKLFHLHFGFDQEPTDQQLEDFVFLCDLFLGLPSIIYDRDVNRRKIFGDLGDFRPKPKYPGLEYRVMGIGMLEYFTVINDGIKNIQDALDRNLVKKLKENFWNTLSSLNDNIKIVNKLKVEKVYNDILRLRNAQEVVSQPLPSAQG